MNGGKKDQRVSTRNITLIRGSRREVLIRDVDDLGWLAFKTNAANGLLENGRDFYIDNYSNTIVVYTSGGRPLYFLEYGDV